MPRGTLLDFDISLGTNKTKQKATGKTQSKPNLVKQHIVCRRKIGKINKLSQAQLEIEIHKLSSWRIFLSVFTESLSQTSNF